MSNPGNFGSKTLNVVLLFGQHILRNEQRKRAVLDAHLLDMRVEPLLDLFPDGVRSRLAVVSIMRYQTHRNSITLRTKHPDTL